jgi:hypothetical protein
MIPLKQNAEDVLEYEAEEDERSGHEFLDKFEMNCYNDS